MNAQTKFSKNLKYAIVSAMLAAIILIMTAYVKIPFGAGGYVHLGDAIIYIAAAFLPWPYAMAAAALGGAMADVVAGYAIWAPFTAVIKLLLTVAFTSRGEKVCGRRNYVACLIGLPVTVLGYYLAEAVIYSDFAAFASMPWNLLQAVASGIVFVLIGKAFDRMDLKRRLITMHF